MTDHLRNVYWLGGSPCSGKSTIADMLHGQYNIAVYHIDDVVRTRFGPYDPKIQPCMYRWSNPNASDTFWDDIWIRPVEDLLKEVFQCYHEQFELVIDELTGAHSEHPILVEGNSLLPYDVAPLLIDRSHALWMTATAPFQRKTYPTRDPWVRQILDQTSSPEAALQNWMDRDVAFADRIRLQTKNLDLANITVDGKHSIEQNAGLASLHFGLDEPHI